MRDEPQRIQTAKDGQTVDIAYSGHEHGEYPATWGQLHAWRCWAQAKPGDGWNMTRRAVLAEPAPLASVVEAWGRLISCHAALRTRLAVAPGGELTQQVTGSGSIEGVLLRCESADDVQAMLAHQTVCRPDDFVDVFAEPPLRLAFVVLGDVVHGFIVVASNLVLDGAAFYLMIDHFLDALRQEELSPPASSPVSEAIAEQLPARRKVSAESVDYWRSVLAVAPLSSLPDRIGFCDGSRIQSAWLVSPWFTYADRVLTSRLKVSSQALFFGASALLLSEMSGQPRVAMQVLCNNRFSGYHGYIGHLQQATIVAVAVADRPLLDIVRDVDRMLLRSYRYARYNEDDLRAAIRDVEETRSGTFNLTCSFNHLSFRNDGAWDGTELIPRPQDMSGPESVYWGEHTKDDAVGFFVVKSTTEEGMTSLGINMDLDFFSMPDLERFLFGVERAIVSLGVA